MRIEIELYNPEFCNSCPCQGGFPGASYRAECNLGYQIFRLEQKPEDDVNQSIPRPHECKMRNGK